MTGFVAASGEPLRCVDGTWRVEGTGFCTRVWRPVTPGLLDEAARGVFLGGQCHALALALRERGVGRLAVLARVRCQQELDECFQDWPVCPCRFAHAAVLLPDGSLLDVTGVFADDPVAWEEEFEEPMVLLVDERAVQSINGALAAGQLPMPAVSLARTFVPLLLERAGR